MKQTSDEILFSGGLHLRKEDGDDRIHLHDDSGLTADRTFEDPFVAFDWLANSTHFIERAPEFRTQALKLLGNMR